MKLTKAQKEALTNKVKHITGECDCPPGHKSCTYWKNVDGKERDWQSREIIKAVESVL